MSICRYLPATAIAFGIALLSGCGLASPRFTSREVPSRAAMPASSDHLRGIASYYADEFNGRKTSNGEIYDMHLLTAAHRTLPFNTRVRVTNLENNRSVVVRINDRGPFKDDRVIDVSLEAAKRLGLITNGTAPVQIEILDLGKDLN
jgi:peptidoglycan lytic transglycosylase